MPKAGSVILITGIMAAGKSTVAQALAERLPKSVHLRGDLFRRMIVNGQEPVTPENWPAAERQLHLRQEIAASVALKFADNGFAVCYQDVILGNDLSRVVDQLGPADHPVYVVVLAPSPEIVSERELTRHKKGYGAWTPFDLDQSLRNETPKIGLCLDTTSRSVDATVNEILNRLDEARVRAPRRMIP
jgi:chloramphenicol 3-O-phosphotransferase